MNIQNNIDPQKQEQLWSAAAQGDSAAVRLLAASGLDVDARNTDGFNAFSLATQNGHTDTALTILAARELNYLKKIGAAYQEPRRKSLFRRGKKQA